MGNREIFIDPAIEKMEQFLLTKGFAKCQWHKKDGSWFYMWNKVESWKKENVTFVFGTREPKDCHLTLYVYIIGANEEYSLDINIDSFAQGAGSKNRFVFPMFFKKWKAPKILNRILSQLETNLSWFDSYKTKKMCLEHMVRQASESKPKGFARKPDNPVYIAIKEVLTSNT